MIDLNELEELFKSVNRNAIKAFLRNSAILKDPSATPEMKELAQANVKAITQNQPIPRPKKKTNKKPEVQATQLVQPVIPQGQAPVQSPQRKMEFHEEFAQHHGIDPVKFKATWNAMTPEQQNTTKQWHTEQLSAAPKIQKSIDKLYDLFAELKKNL